MAETCRERDCVGSILSVAAPNSLPNAMVVLGVMDICPFQNIVTVTKIPARDVGIGKFLRVLKKTDCDP